MHIQKIFAFLAAVIAINAAAIPTEPLQPKDDNHLVENPKRYAKEPMQPKDDNHIVENLRRRTEPLQPKDA
jgi:hypothetical protein